MSSTDVPEPAQRPPSLALPWPATPAYALTSPRPDMTSFIPPISSPLPAAEPQVFSDQFVAEPTEMAQEAEQGDSTKQGAHIQFKPTPPSAFSRVPSIPQLYDLGGPGRPLKARDSVLTQTSGFTQGSSSIYPPSTSTASGTESPPSPRSLMEPEDNNDVASYDPELDQEYDGDDCLLSPPPSRQKQLLSPPGALQAFVVRLCRNGELQKTCPAAANSHDRLFRHLPQVAAFDIYTPVLRTTSDSTTVSAYGHPPQTPRRSTSQVPGAAPDPSGRVVVVREKMYDIASAAKQAEHEMKSRGAARREEEFPGHSEVDVIDPTDVVDVPPPSAAYPFAVQASALHGMGVQDSVGAAQLADRLPPRSPWCGVGGERLAEGVAPCRSKPLSELT
ncbi:hypothetical protein B0H16DRAFT_1714104 [Mycena metata]|uniref:Uncharacterized protein n=1 Tax=Mycena metata TaxID=1033252 RepID=A0AAD7JWF5_9AGAR|nr:hypothetical protein B0H16DRAFT_1714104 [Mycena metata]